MENDNIFESRVDLSVVQETFEAIQKEIGSAVLGQQKIVEQLTIALFCEGHVLIEGMPGVAKTLTAKCLSKTVDAKFSRIQFTPDLMPSDVIGTMIYNPKSTEFDFKSGPIFSNVVLIDEINRAPAKTQSSLFECMEERQITVDGTRYELESPFIVIGTQNPVEHEGTYRLPEAQLDRFMFKLIVDYPNLDDEQKILELHMTGGIHLNLKNINKIIDAKKLKAIQETVKQINVKREILHYIASLIHETRNNPNIYLGASPRAGISLLHSAKTYAAVQGRDFVTPDDVKDMVIPVLNHRIMLTPEKEMQGMTAHTAIQLIVDKVEVPN
ncbi:AAA family ATPase [Fulvivirga lutea]|uniref:MoxR family ATPase n=1 Tax=Fulvivirga lutea TaxID=2810512 RepID=A0A975A297_9BACT|nr:MoxR family ATPase [Fulvivirga lutea]QSE98307.1 MoxR family ATPase [Fulvivirga lutea]